MSATFEVICEVEPATRSDLIHVRHQIGVLSKVATAFLIPDNHLGRATVSSVAVAHEVSQMGGRAIACLNARDRNLLGFRRDLLTAAAYGVDDFLFVYGDRPASGIRSGDLTVRAMLREARSFPVGPSGTTGGFRVGVTSGLAPLPRWKHDADSLFVQVGFSIPQLLDWRTSVDFRGSVFAGVMVVPSVAMARKLSADVPQLRVPEDVIALIDQDPDAGVALACSMIAEIRASGLFDGVHLIPVSRYREVASRLECEV